MFCILKKKKIYPAYVSKHNSNREKQVILLMVLNGEKLHYFAIKHLLSLLKGIKSKNSGDFYCLSFLLFFRTKNQPESLKTVCENQHYKVF